MTCMQIKKLPQLFKRKKSSSDLSGNDPTISIDNPIASPDVTPTEDPAPGAADTQSPGFVLDQQGDMFKATVRVSKQRLLAGGLIGVVLLLFIWYASASAVAGSRIGAAEAAAFETGQSSGYDTGYAEGQTLGYETGKDEGYSTGFTAGEDQGYTSGYEAGKEDGYTAGYEEGYNAGGYKAGKEEGYASGYETGSEEGYASGYEAGKEEGYTSGYETGKDEGYSSGYDAGVADGKATAKETTSGGTSTDDDGDTTGGMVYVSRNGKIHTDPHCSGMKYYTEMSYSSAISKGYEKCKKCY